MIDDSKNNIREIIIKVAQGVFARFGFKKTTMDEIAEAAHKAKSSIYHYFKSKEEIFQTVVEKESQLLKSEIANAIKKEITPQEKIRTYIITRMQIINRLANYYDVLTNEYYDRYSFVEKIRKKHDLDEINMIKSILQLGIKNGIFTITDLEITTIAIFTALMGLEYSWATDNDISKIEKSVDNLLEILFYGIIKT